MATAERTSGYGESSSVERRGEHVRECAECQGRRTEELRVGVDVRVIELGDGDLLEGYPLLLCGKRGGG